MKGPNSSSIHHEMARWELIHRIQLRDNILLIYVALVGAFFGLMSTTRSVSSDLLLIIPYITFGVSILVAHHHVMIGAIGAFLEAELGPFLKSSGDYTPQWDSSTTLAADVYNTPPKYSLTKVGYSVILTTPAFAALLYWVQQTIAVPLDTPNLVWKVVIFLFGFSLTIESIVTIRAENKRRFLIREKALSRLGIVDSDPFKSRGMPDFSAVTNGRRGRSSSFDKTGGDEDYVRIKPLQSHEMLNLKGTSGYVARIWFTIKAEKTPDYLKKTKISMEFDGEKTVFQVPVGIFSGTGPWAVNDIVSNPITVTRSIISTDTENSVGAGSFNILWLMPFNKNARITMTNDANKEISLWYHVDYFVDLPEAENLFLFHASHSVSAKQHAGPKKQKNLSDKENHTFVSINGYSGTYVGTTLAVDASLSEEKEKWYWGDEMFFIDDDNWPPTLHGTGTEDYFGMAFGVKRIHQGWDHGVSSARRNLNENDRPFDGQFTLFRWHLVDPIPFKRKLRASIERGHANNSKQAYESVAFWYGRKIGGGK